MVKLLAKADHDAIAQAIAQAERRTSAEMLVVIAPASDAYQSMMMLYGWLLGSVIDMGLWLTRAASAFPLLLTVQLAAIAALVFIPWLRHGVVRLVPRRMRHHRTAQRAYAEYMKASHHIRADIPFLLLYVSLAERYAHILANPLVRAAIPDKAWEGIMATLTASIPAEGLCPACTKAIGQAADLLAGRFPK